MGEILMIAGAAGLVLTAAAVPIAAVVLRRQEQKLSKLIQEDYEQ